MSSAPTPPREREELAIIVATNGPSVVKIADRILAAGYRKGGGEPSANVIAKERKKWQLERLNAAEKWTTESGIAALEIAWEQCDGIRKSHRGTVVENFRLKAELESLRAALRAQEGTNV